MTAFHPENNTSKTVGVLALQGAFHEHAAILKRIKLKRKIEVVEVRTPEELAQCDGLIVPGGESTSITLLLSSSKLLEPIRDFIHVTKRPVWGTCAGAILLSEIVEGGRAVRGGDSSKVEEGVLKGMPVRIRRNGWGSQVESFTAPLHFDAKTFPESQSSGGDDARTFEGVFIRAPVVIDIAEDKIVEIVATLDEAYLPELLATGPTNAVALRRSHLFLTTFHPELTNDDRVHRWWLEEFVLENT